MLGKLDKLSRARLFRDRLQTAMAEQSVTQAALARTIGVDRSTISALLGPDSARLPNAQVVGECAAALGVSSDWLLGLSERPQQLADLIAASMSITEAPRTLIDDQIFAWHQEAAGYKIRHVPAGLPDILKTDRVLRWEYEMSLGRTPDQAIGATEDRLRWMHGGNSDYEIALPRHELTAFAQGQGYFAGLSLEARQAQLAHLAALHDQLYPSLRVYLFDAHRVFSAPITVFGPLLAVVYLGHNYLAFRDSNRVQAITQHFDLLVREAAISARQFPAELDRLSRLIV